MDFVRPIESVVGGAQGQLLAVLAGVTAPLSLRRLASLAGVSPAQASRVLPRLVDLGIVERYEVPPASQFLLNRDNVASRLLVSLSDTRSTVLLQIGSTVTMMSPEPETVIVFGSLARGGGDMQSDIDIAVIRPDGVDADSDEWADSLDQWRRSIRSLSGNDVEVVEATVSEATAKLNAGSELWRNIARDGIVVHGQGLDALIERADA